MHLLDLALYVGMSVEEYWHGSPSLIYNYVEAHNRRKKDMIEQCWLTGAYVQTAINTSVQLIGFMTKDTKLPKYPSYEEACEEKPQITEEEKAWRLAQLQRIAVSCKQYNKILNS